MYCRLGSYSVACGAIQLLCVPSKNYSAIQYRYTIVSGAVALTSNR